MKFKGTMLLSDMDGTLLDSERNISDENKAALAYYVANGGLFSVATGRAKRTMEHFVSQLPINAPVVVYNGSGVYDFATNRMISQVVMDEGAVDFVQQVCGHFPDLCAEIYLPDGEFGVHINAITKIHFEGIGLPILERAPVDIPQPWVKVNFVADTDRIGVVEQYVRETFPNRYFYQRSGSYFFEAMANGVDKGVGAFAVCDFCGIERQNLFTIGDHMNDIELIEAAGMSFAPANAVDIIKDMADVIVADNDHHALAEVVAYLDKKFG